MRIRAQLESVEVDELGDGRFTVSYPITIEADLPPSSRVDYRLRGWVRVRRPGEKKWRTLGRRKANTVDKVLTWPEMLEWNEDVNNLGIGMGHRGDSHIASSDVEMQEKNPGVGKLRGEGDSYEYYYSNDITKVDKDGNHFRALDEAGVTIADGSLIDIHLEWLVSVVDCNGMVVEQELLTRDVYGMLKDGELIHFWRKKPAVMKPVIVVHMDRPA